MTREGFIRSRLHFPFPNGCRGKATKARKGKINVCLGSHFSIHAAHATEVKVRCERAISDNIVFSVAATGYW
mgnify:FL=1